uniref:Uncharacterized protein n=1 Tax=Eutreptiella gymnastica TaxID=73025 RepID=A0A7S1NTY1_9EUGL
MVIQGCPSDGMQTCQFTFNVHRIASLKHSLNAPLNGSPPGCPPATANDVLMAIAACSLVPFETAQPLAHPTARLSVMADPRGRGLPADYFGNAAHAISLYVDWQVLQSRDLGLVVRTLRMQMDQALEALYVTCKTDPQPAPEQPALLYWNSWGRAQGMLGADFGAGLRRFEWLNLLRLECERVYIVVPVDKDNFMLQVTLPRVQMEHLALVWQAFLPVEP